MSLIAQMLFVLPLLTLGQYLLAEGSSVLGGSATDTSVAIALIVISMLTPAALWFSRKVVGDDHRDFQCAARTLASSALLTVVILTVSLALYPGPHALIHEANALRAHLFRALSLALFAGVTEEIALRAIVMRSVSIWTGSALVGGAVSAGLFGVLHLVNPNATPWSAIAVILGPGAFLAVLYRYGGLWPAVIAHTLWNFVLFAGGYAVSGLGTDTEPDALPWFLGGAFGVEASVFTLAAFSAATLIAWRFHAALAGRSHS